MLRHGRSLLLVALPLLVANAPRAASAALVIATSQTCFGNAVGECENAPSVFGPGALASKSKVWPGGDGFEYAASTSMTADWAAFGGFARASGYETASSDPTFLYSILRAGRSFATFTDELTAGTGGAPGFLRIPLHVVGSASVAWQNGFGSAEFAAGCYSNAPGSITVIGTCSTAQRVFTDNAAIDEVIALDLPIVLGAPFEYSATISVAATTGHLFGDFVPFTGQSEIAVATLPFEGAIVLDASKQPIPGAAISIGESGFDYRAVPESERVLGGLAALVALARRRARSASAANAATP